MCNNKIEGINDRSLNKYTDKFFYENLHSDGFDYTFKTNQNFSQVTLTV